MTRILVVEDESSYSEALSYVLQKEGFDVAVAETGPDAITEFERSGADIVLLDLMLPGLSGTEVCRRIRQSSSVPIIMVSAKEVGLELGADDYVTKPYSPRELVARIRAVLRRGLPDDLHDDAALEAGRIRMDIDRHLVTVDSEPMQLPLKEFELLEYFLRNAGRVLTPGECKKLSAPWRRTSRRRSGPTRWHPVKLNCSAASRLGSDGIAAMSSPGPSSFGAV